MKDKYSNEQTKKEGNDTPIIFVGKSHTPISPSKMDTDNHNGVSDNSSDQASNESNAMTVVGNFIGCLIYPFYIIFSAVATVLKYILTFLKYILMVVLIIVVVMFLIQLITGIPIFAIIRGLILVFLDA